MNKRVTIQINDAITVELNYEGGEIIIHDGDGVVILSEQEFTDIISTVGSHTWAFGNRSTE